MVVTDSVLGFRGLDIYVHILKNGTRSTTYLGFPKQNLGIINVLILS